MNLLGNAVKFSPVGGRLYLSVRSEDSGGFPRVRVSLADGGIGIPPDQLDQIFERFHQVDSSEARPSGGTGLGLAISREIVRHHGGEIWAENRPAGGAVFHFTLPAARVGSADDPATREGGQPS
jgi:two-component system sensor histidine kinase VicK